MVVVVVSGIDGVEFGVVEFVVYLLFCFGRLFFVLVFGIELIVKGVFEVVLVVCEGIGLSMDDVVVELVVNGLWVIVVVYC